MPIKVGTLSIFTPLNFAVLLSSRNKVSNVQGWKSSRNRVPINTAQGVDIGSACVDIRPS